VAAEIPPGGSGSVAVMVCRRCNSRFTVLPKHTFSVRCPGCDAALEPTTKLAAPTPRPSTPEETIGRTIGGCRILGVIGRGAFGVVYRAEHTALKREVAVKMVPITARKRPLLKRLVFEARTIAKIEHPNVVQVHDVGVQSPYLFIVMQLLRGETLQQQMEAGEILPDEGVEVVRQIARGLLAAHVKGVLHRDVKPTNVIVVGDVCKLVDFGLARDLAAGDEYSGMIVGTPYYISPEQWSGRAVDARSDLYSLGAILYQILTGRHPFQGKSMGELMQQHLRSLPPLPHLVNRAVSEDLSAIVMKLLAKEPDRRYPDAKALLEDLDRYDRREQVGAMTESRRLVRCGMCDTLNPSTLSNCKICGESVRPAEGLEMELRSDEFNCPACEEIVRAGAETCPSCRQAFCSKCRRRLPVLRGMCEFCGSM
jgi:tRNA A-37 threonylcarbamoyl transferase component Bud32